MLYQEVMKNFLRSGRSQGKARKTKVEKSDHPVSLCSTLQISCKSLPHVVKMWEIKGPKRSPDLRTSKSELRSLKYH